MKKFEGFVATACLLLLVGAASGCKKKEPASAGEPTPASDPASSAGAASAAGSAAAAGEAAAQAAEEARAEAAETATQKAALLAYATMEDRYLNDSKGQWASEAKASSFYGSDRADPADEQGSNRPWQASGAPNGNSWSNDHIDLGIDWLELAYPIARPATELRAVLTGGVGAISKVELIDDAGASHEVWSGADDTQQDRRGPRTWFVRTFDKTPYNVAKVKLSFANAVVSSYKEVDAVQLVGE